MPRDRLDMADRGRGDTGGADIRIDTDVFRALSDVGSRPRRSTMPTIARWFDTWRN